ncbi:hypothetical protein GGI07_003213 [Coemansia sp. Benny D115]|nr:hypothetical protein GGI07_003213 [Coemansia sp. Benny D115]
MSPNGVDRVARTLQKLEQRAGAALQAVVLLQKLRVETSIMALTDSRLLPKELRGKKAIRVCIDRGGTFTDCVAKFPVTTSDPVEERTLAIKLLSEDPQHYADAPLEGLWRILEHALGQKLPRNQPLDTSDLQWVRMGTTVATNALLERTGERTVLVTTRGFGDILRIGNQARPHIFDLAIERPEPLCEETIEIDERVLLKEDGSAEAERVPDWDKVAEQLAGARQRGITSAAVCLLHGTALGDHEARVAEMARQAGFGHVTEARKLAVARLVPRAQSAACDAYLTPGIARYIAGFEQGAQGVEVEFMQSDGGLAPAHGFSGLRAILSGPAGGVVGFARTAYSMEARQPVVGFDMGGTSTDVSRYAGQLEHVFEANTAGVAVAAPQLAIHTVAAGGGSRLFFRGGLLQVGPESAGAHPGPACYRKGGSLALTDANVALGRLRAAHFPRIFGPNEDEPLDTEAPRRLLADLAAELAAESGAEPMSVEALALGFVHVANEAMCRPIRALTEARGHAPRDHALACFGGAGGQHACAVARRLGIRRVYVHRLAPVLSAVGLGLAERAHEERRACADAPPWTPTVHKEILAPQLDELEQQARAKLTGRVEAKRFLLMRYVGADACLAVEQPDDGDFGAAFLAQHKAEFGFVLPGERELAVDSLRVRATAASREAPPADAYAELATLERRPPADSALLETAQVYFDGGFRDAAVYDLDALRAGETILGPALVLNRNSTVLVEPGWRATATSEQLVLDDEEDSNDIIASDDDEVVQPDPVTLAVLAHRFMGIAEHMGRALQKTSVSTNIKERLDFSCALFDSHGGLVANAPHIPVHLGSMSHAVRFQLRRCQADPALALQPGDVLLANHPQAGGSHLPDITVITPLFVGDKEPAFFVASRAHHADIGGTTPGSMPPSSTELYQEGAVTAGMRIVHQGAFQEAELRRFLVDEPAKHAGCSGSRNYRDVLSDVKAQVAANHRGVLLINELCAQYGLRAIQAYMGFLQDAASQAVRELLKDTRKRHGGKQLRAEDRMDDGSRICLTVDISEDGSAHFDFAGTSPQVYGNTNAPPAVTASAVIYCLRCLVQNDLPLNQGCLAPVRISVPRGSLLAPAPEAAVVGGNVLTSQRLCDVILAAFGAAAASQGCMNNLTFGLPPATPGAQGWGYYETIAGGHGAGPTWSGQSGVHTHMTNTRITDPEVLERRYPVVLRRFSLRPASGGCGLHSGGDGCVREIEFHRSMAVSLLTERRVFAPPGLAGGMPGKCGMNLWKRRREDNGNQAIFEENSEISSKDTTENASASLDGDDQSLYRVINIGAKNTVYVSPGDRIVIMTPGGGGWGTPSLNIK